MKYTVVLDFDGVIHSYSSGWRGKTCIPDLPVPGIREEIYKMRQIYRVVVVSTRCDTQDGMDAVKAYLKQNGIEVDAVMKEKPPAVAYVDDRAICFDGQADGLLKKIVDFKPWTDK